MIMSGMNTDKIINASKVSSGADAIYDVWNEHKPEQVCDKKCCIHQNSLLTDNDINLSMSRNIYKNLKEKFHNNKRKHNVRPRDIFWRKVPADKVLQGEGSRPICTYLDSRQATVVE